MLTANDILSTNIHYKKINFNRTETGPVSPQKIEVKYHIKGKWGIAAVRQDNHGIKIKAIYEVTSDVLNIEIEAIVTVEFNKRIDRDELISKDTQKMCITESASYITQLISEITSKMGMSPFIINPEIIKDM